jgi:hypothetical protein
MLNKTEYNGVYISMLPLGVKPTKYNKLHKSSRKNAPKREVVETNEMRQTTIHCNNGTIHIKGERDKCVEVAEWLKMFGITSFSHIHKNENITIDESGVFHIFGDENDGNYRYFRGDFMHKEPYKCFGLVEVEPMEDGGQVWRDFSDFDVEVTFKVYSESEEEEEELIFI